MGKARGLTLAELVVAIGMLGIVSITVAGVFTHLLNSSSKTTDLTAARVLAGQILDKAVRAGPPTFGHANLLDNPVRLKSQDAQTQTEYIYNIYPSPLKNDGLIPGVTRRLYFVEVEVTWSADGYRAEQGKLSTKLSQAVHYER